MIELKPGAYPPPALLLAATIRETRGLRARDTALVARASDIGIWHTNKTASHDYPHWLPPFGAKYAIYRGFPRQKLRTVLETGLDVPPESAFFATNYPDKAWEYPLGRDIATMLVLDGEMVERSYEIEPLGASDHWTPNKVNYPNEYTEGRRHIHTRFDPARGLPNFTFESMYGHWIPGDARAAMLGVVIGGPKSTVLHMLQELQSDTSRPELIQLEAEHGAASEVPPNPLR